MSEQELNPPKTQQESAEPQARAEAKFAPRIPIRLRWTMLVGFTVALSVVVLFFVILDIERDAWLESQAAQAELQVDRLTDELKLPMLSGSSAETDLVVQGFLEKVPTVLGVLLKKVDGGVRRYGEVGDGKALSSAQINGTKVQQLSIGALWYAKSVRYAKTDLGEVAVHFSEQAWEEIASQLVKEILLGALIVVLISALWVYWLAGKMSQRLEMLANAAGKVAGGDYHVKMPVRGNDEISDAISQFNMMAKELLHKEALRNVFERYLNPKLVTDVFEGGQMKLENHRQEVSVLFADMVHFTSFSEITDTEEVVNVLNTHFEVFNRIIAYYGGHVDKYIGDAVMAVFNHPFADKDHARHAAKAGLAIAVACRELGVVRFDGEPISFRIGLNCGQAIAGNIGAAKRLEYTIIGDAVNVASRMSSVGEGGELVMSRATFEQLGPGFGFRSIGEQDIKGVSHDLELGVVEVKSEQVKRNIEHVVDLAFNLQLPEDVQKMEGDV
ncbi:Adenylate cyclase, class 3 [Mariprofundus ferrinatatus]|uniref:Adenylate cyclase, class 3 n=1 Tax=Mariprofundus ferrinatatus TaxID=1921087 RepID=A0A2K8L8C8_9PROT|nr:adenylate/guanylate cyclase domain-containing protein [Mariprofundus ferrinatatus]ATX81194.1 Adenylate cyclase, class 3 [Mariprofundus ferrinatatus]